MFRIKLLIFTSVLSLLCGRGLAKGHADDYGVLCKNVGREWVWFSEHIVASITYVVAPEEGYQVEVGTGVFYKKPYGSVVTITNGQLITAYGAGALHVRSISINPVRVCVTQEDINLITIYRRYF